MKKTRRFSAALMALVMLFTCASTFTTSAQSSDLWDAYYNASTQQIQAAVMLTPGSDNSERYVSWYSETESGQAVLLDAFGREIKKFDAVATATPQGDYRLGAVISDLEVGSTYKYYCTSGDWKSTTYTFSVSDDTSFTAMYLTDVHVSGSDVSEEENAASIRQTAGGFNTTLTAGVAKAATQGKSVDLILSAGDQASEGTREEYAGFCANEFVKAIPTATVIGNHDRKSVDYRYFTFQPNTADMTLKSYVGTDYWFVKGDVLFFMLDSNNTSMADHRRFVKEAVEANPDIKWRVAVFHHDLYSGRIPRRESENELLRIMWAPIADEFGFDLCLLGHSHYYTISNVMYNNKTVTATENDGTVTDPEGTVYMVSGSVNRPRNDDDIGLSENIGHAHLTDEKIYNLIDFNEDSIVIKSYTVESDEEIGNITIEKTTDEGGHTYKTPAKWYYPLIDVISFIVGIFNNIGVYADNTELGFDIPLFEGIFG